MRASERLQGLRPRLALGAGVVLPLASAVAWCCAGRPLTGLLGLIAAVLGARVYRCRMGRPLFLMPTWLVGDPNHRKPLVIERTQWPQGGDRGQG